MSRLLSCSLLLMTTFAVADEPRRLSLWDGDAPITEQQSEKADAFITVYQPTDSNGTAVVICPGGGYGGLAIEPEGHGIARWLNKRGITGVVLQYRLPAGRPFVPLFDAQRAIRTVRANAKQWNVDPTRVGIIGFSAGGHLASTAGTHFDEGDSTADDSIERFSSRPDFMILVYPVVTMGEATHGGSKRNLLGAEPTEALIELFSNEKQVTTDTPPTFLAHAQDDTPVPPQNSRGFFDALKRSDVLAEYLALPRGGHGLNGYKGPMWDAWQTRSLAWLAEQKLIPSEDQREPCPHSNKDQASSRHVPDGDVHLIRELPFVAATSGTYQLASDLSFSKGSGAAITIRADDVTLDLDGKTLRGETDAATTAIGVLAIDRHRITISNGRIQGFYFGIDIRATDRNTKASTRHVLTRLVAERNWYFGMRVVGSNCLIADSQILDTGGSTKPRHTIPHGVRLVGENNTMRNCCVRNLHLKKFSDGKGEVVGVHFDAATGSVFESNGLVEVETSDDETFPVDDTRERRFGLWVNGGAQKNTFLRVENNTFDGFVVPIAFAPGSDGIVTGNMFVNANAKPIRGKPAAQLTENIRVLRSLP